jgi:chromosome partitioning protein
MNSSHQDMSVPQIIVLATGKGGVGKSTLARSLAAHWLMSGHRPALIDADPQASIAHLHNPAGPMAAIPVIEAPEEAVVGNVIEELKAKHDVILVDTAGFRNRTTIMALVAADLAVIPLKPAAEDAREAVEMLSLVTEINDTVERREMKGGPLPACMVLTMSSRGTVIARHIRAELEAAKYPLLKHEMVHRVAYPEASISGLAPNMVEPDGAAARDIARLAGEIAAWGRED